MTKKILITGGAGFIGSCFVRTIVQYYHDYECFILDKLTYCGEKENISDVFDSITFIYGDICNKDLLDELFSKYHFDYVINFAAETHIDASIKDSKVFIQSNVLGTHCLLEVSKQHKLQLFLQVGTDEVYGEILKGTSLETDLLQPRNPYSASKAAADHLALSYFVTHDVPVIISRCCNNYGPYQFREKLIPLFISNLMKKEKVRLYGDGYQIRTWIYVQEHVDALILLMEKGKCGEIYNIGTDVEKTNREVTSFILKELELSKKWITYVEDRKGHDRRYALNTDKIKQLGWVPQSSFDEMLRHTIRWYQQN